jgi:hypothetical protein
MADELAWGWEEMAKDGDDARSVTEPEIIRTLAVGSVAVRFESGQVYIDAHERLAGETRVAARLAMSPDMARELVAKLAPVIARKRH